MSGTTDIGNRLIDEAIAGGGDIDRDAVARRLVAIVDEDTRTNFTFEGAAKFVSGLLRKRSIHKLAAPTTVQTELFGETIHALYPVDGEDGRKWRSTPVLSEFEAEQVFARLVTQRRGLDMHIADFETMLRTARPIWRVQPEISLGEALKVASEQSLLSAAE